jgi:hypothetical protein
MLPTRETVGAIICADELTQGDIIRHFTGEIWQVYSEPVYTRRGMVFDVLPLDFDTIETFQVIFAPGWRFELTGHQSNQESTEVAA